MTKLLILGRSGRMGQALIEVSSLDNGVEVLQTHDVGESLEESFEGVDAVIDFTLHHVTESILKVAIEKKVPVVIGTTGHSESEKKSILEASKYIPIVYAANYSIGVNTLFWLTQKAAQVLDDDQFNIEVVEMHHKHKIDAPSGTARRLLEILNEETQTSYENDVTHGRVGNIGARKPKEIGMHTLRGGDVVGDHTVMFAAEGERVELTHKASSRLTFASGAVRAAKWVCSQTHGVFDMQDVLGLK